MAVQLYGLTEGAEAFRAPMREYGHWIILLKGLTPIPYKLVTITSGFAGYDLFWFVVLSIITRGARFFVLAALLGRFGPYIKGILDRHFNAVAAAPRRHDRRRFRSVPLPVLKRAPMPPAARAPQTGSALADPLAALAATIGGALVFEHGFGLSPASSA